MSSASWPAPTVDTEPIIAVDAGLIVGRGAALKEPEDRLLQRWTRVGPELVVTADVGSGLSLGVGLGYQRGSYESVSRNEYSLRVVGRHTFRAADLVSHTIGFGLGFVSSHVGADSALYEQYHFDKTTQTRGWLSLSYRPALALGAGLFLGVELCTGFSYDNYELMIRPGVEYRW